MPKLNYQQGGPQVAKLVWVNGSNERGALSEMGVGIWGSMGGKKREAEVKIDGGGEEVLRCAGTVSRRGYGAGTG